MNLITWIMFTMVLDISFTIDTHDYPRWEQPLKALDYKWEAIKVRTRDYYELTLFNIKGNKGKATLPPVLIMHSENTDASWWIEMQRKSKVKPEKRLYGDITPWMMQLADKGHDVWMGNSRGTEYSMGHTKLEPEKSEKYWDFTWAEMGMYDLTAMIEEIKIATGEEKILYIGYS